jgi:hypothetical protein
MERSLAFHSSWVDTFCFQTSMDYTQRVARKEFRKEVREARKRQRMESARMRRHVRRQMLLLKWLQIRDVYYSVSGFMVALVSIAGEKSLRKDFLYTIINSTFSFILAFLVVRYVNIFITTLVAQLFGIPVVLYSFSIHLPLYTYSSLYTPAALITIFGTGPFISLVAGFLLYRWYMRIIWRKLIAKTFIIWLIFHAVNMFFGAYISGALTRTGFIYSIEWMFNTSAFDITEVIFLAASAVGMLWFGSMLTRPFILAANTENIIKHEFRLHYLLSEVFLPWLAGSMFLYLMNYPRLAVDLIILYLASLLMIVPLFINFRKLGIRLMQIPGLPDKVKIGWVYILLVVFLAVIVRAFVFHGIRIA